MPIRDVFLQFAPPDIGEEEIAEVVECLRSGWITTGPRVARFEKDFADYVGAESALALSSGTGALHTALAALGIGPGDSVVVPTMTFSSAAHVVEHVGARPVLVDSEPDTLNLDPARVEEALDDPTVRCISPTHLYGHPCDIGSILDLADSRGIAVVEDAAHALPARIGERTIGAPTGPRGLTAFSFYATKNLTTGEGGMLTGPITLLEDARSWSLHGMSRDAWARYDDGGSWRYDVTRAGYKYNMADIQAAIGIVQLRRLDAMHARRRDIAARYTAAFDPMTQIDVPAVRPGTEHAWHIYAIRLVLSELAIDRAHFIGELGRRNIGTSVHFIPLHLLTYYRDRYGYLPDDFPVATREFDRIVSLPIHTPMTDEDVDDVIEAVTDVVDNHRR